MKVLREMHDCVVFSEEDITEILEKMGWDCIIDCVAETFAEEAKGQTVAPSKTIIDLSRHSNDYRVMPAFMEKYPGYCGTKIVCACPLNTTKHNLPLAMGVYILNKAETQQTIMICPATILTAYRTAAASAVAVRELSSEDAKVLGIIGCGQQARFHIPAISTVRNIKKVLVYDINEKCADSLTCSFEGFPLRKVQSKKEIFALSDILVTMTPAVSPFLFVEDLPSEREMMIAAIGGDSDKKIEFSPDVLTAVDYFCDSYEQVMHTGLMVSAAKHKIATDKLKSLGAYMSGGAQLDSSKNIRMFISTGVALQDLRTAILLYENRSFLDRKVNGNLAFQSHAIGPQLPLFSPAALN